MRKKLNRKNISKIGLSQSVGLAGHKIMHTAYTWGRHFPHGTNYPPPSASDVYGQFFLHRNKRNIFTITAFATVIVRQNKSC